MPGGGWTLNFTGVIDEQGNDTTAFVNGRFSSAGDHPDADA